MGLYYCVNGIQNIRFQLCIVPFTINEQRMLQLPPAYTEAGSYFPPEYKKEIQDKINAQPAELRVISMPYVWMERPHKPRVLFHHDLWETPLARSLNNALSQAKFRGFNIALCLFRNHFGSYHTAEDKLTTIIIEECRNFLAGNPDIDIHLLLSTLDQEAYQMLKDRAVAKEECAPNFMTLQEA